MSSNWSTGTNTIQEVDTNKNLTCQMFKVRKQGGGTEYLVRKSDVTLGTKSVTQNGTYTAASAGKYGFSQFSVNVRGGNGSADSHGKPTGGDIKPGGAGSAVVGTDPETGEDVVVGVDESGNIVQTQIPYGIKIVTPPTKTDYVYQETMDYTGLGVKLTNKNGDTYTDVDHPSGWYVNPEDLIFPVEKAPAGSGSYDPAMCNLSSWTQQSISIQSNVYADGVNTITIKTIPGYDHLVLPYAVQEYKNYIFKVKISAPAYTQDPSVGDEIVAIMDHSPSSSWIQTQTGILAFDTYSSGATKNFNINFNSGSHSTVFLVISFDSINDGQTLTFTISNIIVDDGSGGSGVATIPVKWNNPYTGDTHQDTFEITSTSADGDAHTSTGSSGTEGSGGGGTF